MFVMIKKCSFLFLMALLLVSCGGMEPVVFDDSHRPGVSMAGASMTGTAVTSSGVGSASEMETIALDSPPQYVGSNQATGFQGDMSLDGQENNVSPPSSVIDAMPGSFIPEGGSPGFDLFNVENPIEIARTNQNAAPAPVPQGSSFQPTLSQGAYGASGSSVGTSFIPDASKREVVVRSYNHTPGTSGLNVGDSFTFSNPTTTYKVRSITVDSIFWDTDGGEQSVTTHNLLLPAASWSSESRGQGSREITQVQGGLFPLAVGNTMSFKVVTKANISPYRWDSFWSCSVINRGFVTVVAGEFDVYIITCSRSSLEEITFYFAPKLGHYVRQEVNSPGNPEVYVREMIAYDRPNLSYSAGVPSRVDNTLMTGISPGSRAKFRSTYLPSRDSLDSKVEDAVRVQQQFNNNARDSLAATSSTVRTPSRTVTVRDAGSSSSSVANVSVQGYPMGINIHLASYKKEKNLDVGWRYLQGKVSVLRGLSSSSLLVDIPSRGGLFYRLFAGPFPSSSSASSICSEVKSAGEYCQVVRTN